MTKKYQWKLTPLAVASIGAIDEFFDLYIELQKIYDAVKNIRLETQGNLNNFFPEYWDREARKQVRQAVEPILRKYLPLFLDGEHKIHATAYGFASFSLIRITYEDDKYIGTLKYISFSAFLVALQYAVTRIVYRWKAQNVPEIPFKSVCDEINNHIAEYVKEHTLIRIYSNHSPTTDISEKCSMLYIYKNLATVSCWVKKHSIIATTCKVGFISGEGSIRLPVHYCNNCKKYFIGEITLSLFEKKFGNFLLKRARIDSRNALNLDKESILFQFGYNVSDGRSEVERQKLLALLLESGCLSYIEIVKCLEFNIKMHVQHPEAVIKWKRDLKYISDYIMQTEHSALADKR